jgi:hypothetical protein
MIYIYKLNWNKREVLKKYILQKKLTWKNYIGYLLSVVFFVFFPFFHRNPILLFFPGELSTLA